MKKHLFKIVCTLLVWSGVMAAPMAQTNYVLGPQDVVSITVLGEEDLSRKYTIEQDGTFTFPLIGRVTARGLTLRALEQEIRSKLAASYLKNPQVSVAVDAYQSQRIMIWGQVNAPGEYQLTGDMTLLSALAKAGSVTPTAGREAVIVRSPKRSGAGAAAEPEILRIDLNDLQAGNMALNIPLLDGDTINVPKAQSVFVSGHVKDPGAYPVDEGMTVLQVLSLAGGLTDRGSDKRITITRTVDGKKKDLKGVKLTSVVQPGDTIVVGQRIF
ncbi:MAG TPA: polysaccharide biosynthesis/export family protein [Vicinamibacterales bacterium]|nr:polysaccharide biosynthesis/export family protein [Vicinamibacterales bacterium]